MKIENIFLALLRDQLNNEALPLEMQESLRDSCNFAALYKLSKKYDLAHLISDTLNK